MEGPHVSLPSTRQLLGRIGTTFAIAFVALSLPLLTTFARRNMALLDATAVTAGTQIEIWKLGFPIVAAMILPLSVFVAVIFQFTRLGSTGTLVAARQERDGVRRLVAPVIGAAAVMTVVMFVLAAEIVPRANMRLAAVRNGNTPVHTDRSMTLGQLRTAVHDAATNTDVDALSRAAAFNVEIQKKLAVPFACLILAVAGMALAFRFPGGGRKLAIAATLGVFCGYYRLLNAGEVLADEQVVSPFVGTWGANAIVVVVALLAMWRRRAPLASNGQESVTTGN